MGGEGRRYHSCLHTLDTHMVPGWHLGAGKVRPLSGWSRPDCLLGSSVAKGKRGVTLGETHHVCCKWYLEEISKRVHGKEKEVQQAHM